MPCARSRVSAEASHHANQGPKPLGAVSNPSEAMNNKEPEKHQAQPFVHPSCRPGGPAGFGFTPRSGGVLIFLCLAFAFAGFQHAGESIGSSIFGGVSLAVSLVLAWRYRKGFRNQGGEDLRKLYNSRPF